MEESQGDGWKEEEAEKEKAMVIETELWEEPAIGQKCGERLNWGW